MRFVDTNIPVYAVSTLPEDAPKQQVAEHLLSEPDLAFSAAESGTSVSALVRGHSSDFETREIVESIRARGGGLHSSDNMTREELRNAIR